MRILHFEYDYDLNFSTPVDEHQFLLRCIPRDGTHQKVLDIQYTIDPADTVSRIKDGFGNPTYVGSCLAPHDHFSFYVKGKMITSDEPIQEEGTCYPIYKYETLLTKADESILAFAKQYQLENNEKTAWALMHAVYDYMEYVPNSTNNTTTASMAFSQRKGVCQDYAHILISALRSIGIPARYVAGMFIGEGATHAWVDAYVNDHFIHLDPTNNQEADEKYIKLSHGRDFHDCIIDKGTFNATQICNQTMNVFVKVYEEK